MLFECQGNGFVAQNSAQSFMRAVVVYCDDPVYIQMRNHRNNNDVGLVSIHSHSVQYVAAPNNIEKLFRREQHENRVCLSNKNK